MRCWSATRTPACTSGSTSRRPPDRMDESKARDLTAALISGAAELYAVARTAARNGKRLVGAGFYPDKFHNEVVKLARVEIEVMPVIETITGFDPGLLRRHLEIAKSASSDIRARDEARKQIRLICE